MKYTDEKQFAAANIFGKGKPNDCLLYTSNFWPAGRIWRVKSQPISSPTTMHR